MNDHREMPLEVLGQGALTVSVGPVAVPLLHRPVLAHHPQLNPDLPQSVQVLKVEHTSGQGGRVMKEEGQPYEPYWHQPFTSFPHHPHPAFRPMHALHGKPGVRQVAGQSADWVTKVCGQASVICWHVPPQKLHPACCKQVVHEV